MRRVRMISINLFAITLALLITVTIYLIGSLFAYRELWEEKETLLSQVRYYEALRPQKQTDATEHQVCLARNGADELQEVER